VDAAIGRCLLAEGPVTYEFVRRQLAVGGKADTYLGQLVASLPAPREQDLFNLIGAGYRVPEIDLKQTKVHVAIARSVPREVALKYKVVAIDRIGDLLCVVFAGQPNPKALEAVRRATGLQVKAFSCPRHHLQILLRRLFSRGGAASKSAPTPQPDSVAKGVPVTGDGRNAAEVRWEAVHATKGPVRAVRYEEP
jgi:type IV pilus assembly protein PilB